MVLKKLGMSKKFVSWILFELYNNRKKEEREREFFGIIEEILEKKKKTLNHSLYSRQNIRLPLAVSGKTTLPWV